MRERRHRSFLQSIRDTWTEALGGLAKAVAPRAESTPSPGRAIVEAPPATDRYRNIEQTLRFIAQLGWTGKSDTFLTALAQYLGESSMSTTW